MQLKDVEFSKFSQNGEDGIIAHLVARQELCAQSFVEIGCGSGKENNTTWLVHNGWTGTAIDSKLARIEQYRERAFIGVAAYCLKVVPTMSDYLLTIFPQRVDVFSLDIDSWDFHIMLNLLHRGFRPSIAVLEYNASFGPDRSICVPYPMRNQVKDIYYGASLTCWHTLMAKYGYRFVTVDSAGVNAIYLLEGTGTFEFEPSQWEDNKAMLQRFGSLEDRWAKIAELPYTKVWRQSAC